MLLYSVATDIFVVADKNLSMLFHSNHKNVTISNIDLDPRL